jgi:hypothetical protein
MADKPRTFKEVVAAESPADRVRWERAGHYKDPSAEDDFNAGVWVIEKLEGDGWVVAHQNDDGAMFMAIFEGYAPEARARDYFEALKDGKLPIL